MNVLFIVPYPIDKAPGQRYRCEQYLKFFQQNQFTYIFSPFFSTSGYLSLYQKGHYLKKIGNVLRGLLYRLRDVFRASQFDCVYIYREATPFNLFVVEYLLKLRSKKLIYDFDDSIWIPDASKANAWIRHIKTGSKVAKIIHSADCTLVANAYLKSYALKFNQKITIFPTTIDTTIYNHMVNHRPKKILTIGWTGSNTTVKYFLTLLPVLEQLYQEIPFRLKLIADRHTKIVTTITFAKVIWESKLEVQQLADIDIGINPMPLEPWTKGKSSLKAMQYMAMGIPAISTDYDFSRTLIDHGRTGFLASTSPQWKTYLTRLLTDLELRKNMGSKGRKVILDRFSNEANWPILKKALEHGG